MEIDGHEWTEKDSENAWKMILVSIFWAAKYKNEGVESLYPILGEKEAKNFAEHFDKFEKSVPQNIDDSKGGNHEPN